VLKSNFVKLSVLVLFLDGATVFAKGGERHLPVGIVGPSLIQSLQVNPGALTGESTSRLGLFPGPDILGKGFETYEAAFAHSNEKWAAAVQYSRISGVETIYGGFGFRTGVAGIGFNVDYPVTAGSSPGFDLGLQLGGGKGVNYGLVVYNLGAAPSLGLGIGYLEPEKLTIELNFLTPTLESLTTVGSSYTLALGGSVYESIFGLSFVAAYQYTLGNTQTNQIETTFSFLVNPENFPALSMNFTGGSFYSFGISFDF